jgi:hypothetical protein
MISLSGGGGLAALPEICAMSSLSVWSGCRCSSSLKVDVETKVFGDAVGIDDHLLVAYL